MSKITKQFKKDFENSSPKELSFDVSKLENNTWKTRHKIKPSKLTGLIITSAILTALVAVTIPALQSLLQPSSNFNLTRRKYTANEIKIAESNSFKALNSVSFPELNRPQQNEITSFEQEAYANFSSETYKSLLKTSKQENFTYSIVGLYSVLNELTEGASDAKIKTKLNNLLGLTNEERIAFYSKIMYANSFYSQEGNSTTSLKNGAFISDKFNYSQNYVSNLSKFYCQTFQADLKKDSSKIVDWVNKAVKSEKFIDNQFLDINDKTVFLLFSTMDFKNQWNTKYLSDNNVKDDFYLNDGTTVKATYMKHTYIDSAYYDYGSYISFKDYYYNNFYSITYLVPKSTGDNIYNLIGDRNIFFEDDSYKVNPSKTGSGTKNFMIHLQAPKFEFKNDLDFEKSLSNLGLEDMFDENKNSFRNVFDDPKTSEYFIYLQYIKQRNQIQFNEDGTIIKTVTIGAGGAKNVSISQFDTLDISLSSPFIYIIKDVNGNPIFMGHVDNPCK